MEGFEEGGVEAKGFEGLEVGVEEEVWKGLRTVDEEVEGLNGGGRGRTESLIATGIVIVVKRRGGEGGEGAGAYRSESAAPGSGIGTHDDAAGGMTPRPRDPEKSLAEKTPTSPPRRRGDGVLLAMPSATWH